MIAFRVLCSSLILLAVPAIWAFDGHKVKEGSLELAIGEVADVTEFETPSEVAVTLKNSGDQPLRVRLTMGGLVDEWRAVGETEKQVEVGPKGEARAVFQILAGAGACSALYPVHIYAKFEHEGREVVAHAVQIFKSDFTKARAASSQAERMSATTVPARGALALDSIRMQRVAWCYYDKPLVYMPVGWQGTDPQSSAHFLRGSHGRGTPKSALIMHPPWKPGGGTIFAEYLLKLPQTTPIKFMFSNAIREHSAKEPPSDGVTFRVWVDAEKVFERHTDSKAWVEGEADLSKFAGKEILLRLESHPGPKRNTTCDSSFWGEPTVVAGNPPPMLTEAERRLLQEEALQAALFGAPRGAGQYLFTLDGGATAVLGLGRNGLADAAIAFGAGGRAVAFEGLRLAVFGHKVGQWPSQIIVDGVEVKQDWFGRLKVVHRLSLSDERFDLTGEVWKDKCGLRVRVSCPKRLTDISLGPANQKAARVYYGHGYVIVEPEAFRAGFGGHNLSTSHVGFDFEKGVSLLVACDTPPSSLDVDPEQRLYALRTHMDSTLTFVPGAGGALDCAIRYRPLYDKKAAGGVRRKAGRFVFDIWGGRYAEIADTMRRMIAYGLTDSLLTVHNWQRWGYDYRLPDIYPPNPKLGTVADMQQIAEVCKAHDIPWGLHDNYIDFYPDAEGYSYEHICFTEDGRPIKAWLNEGREAQSYRWRPDRIMPFVQRNLKLVRANLRPTHYFLDVFASISCFDYYDRQGNFHSSLETRKCWGEVFGWIRNYLGGNAPTTSEAGHDQLIGYLDGADCQHMLLKSESVRYGKRLISKDWERVPWFDAVLHDKFSLHGVGYSSRYQGGRSRLHHGIESDDYISAEILEGHALMIDHAAFGRGAVRKYWLAQDFIRSIALDSIEKIEFVDGDIHRQVVSWKSGARVWVNRGEKDWMVEGRTLPQYGYFAKNGEIESSIERINGVIVDQSRGPSRCYVNGRNFDPDVRLKIRPTADRVEYLGDRKFRLVVNWDAQQPAPKDLVIFLHFDSDKSPRRDKIAFQGDYAPIPGASAWEGLVTTGADRVIEIPKPWGAGEYGITIGLYDPVGGKRHPLIGEDDGSSRYRLGRLVVEGEGDVVKGVRLVKLEPRPEPPPRTNVRKIPINFGPVITDGAVRCEAKSGKIVVTPLPDCEPFAVTLDLAQFPFRPAPVRLVRAVDMNRTETRQLAFEAEGTKVKFRCERDFAYEVMF